MMFIFHILKGLKSRLLFSRLLQLQGAKNGAVVDTDLLLTLATVIVIVIMLLMTMIIMITITIIIAIMKIVTVATCFL